MLQLLLSIAALLSQFVQADLISPALRAAKIGGCVDEVDDEFVQCAVAAYECELLDGFTTFKSAIELAHFRLDECTTDNLPVGTCESEGKCAVTEDSCRSLADFRPPQPFSKCNAEGTFQNGVYVPTQYGGCKHRETGAIECVLSPGDCTTKESWIPAYAVELEREGGCNCHDIKVGSCMVGNDFTNCAISPDDCVFTKTFSPARQGRINDPGVDCRFCSFDFNFSPANDDMELKDEVEMINEKESDALYAGEIVGIILGGLTTLTFLVMGFFLWRMHIKPYLDEVDLVVEEDQLNVPEIS